RNWRFNSALGTLTSGGGLNRRMSSLILSSLLRPAWPCSLWSWSTFPLRARVKLPASVGNCIAQLDASVQLDIWGDLTSEGPPVLSKLQTVAAQEFRAG